MTTPATRASEALDAEREAGATDILVEPDWLEARLGDPAVRIIEVDVNAKAYSDGHIPGAVLWNAYADLKRPDYRPVDADAIRALFERSGITPEQTLVFYGYAPSLAFWVMKLYRHRNVRILNAARAVWQDAGRPWTTAPASVEPTHYPLPDEDHSIRADLEDVRHAIGDPRTTILDVRTPEEYSGERFWPSGAPEPNGRAGRVPTAVNRNAAALFDDRGRFLDRDALTSLFADVVPPDAEVITYCTIGNRGSAAWFAFRFLLGHDRARVYDGSWAEWGHSEGVPVEVDNVR